MATMAASSRRFFFNPCFLGIHRIALANTSPTFSKKTPSVFNSQSHILSTKTPSTLHLIPFHGFNNFCSSATATADTFNTDNAETQPTNSVNVHSLHPWPEWLTLVKFLKSNGYFGDCASERDVVDGGGDDGFDTNSSHYLNDLKDAFIKFARHRVDILKSLSREDIQTVVGCGCPILFRKVVNSAKRLRAFVKLDEGDVCSACNLRKSCDRAYTMLQKPDADARTVDIVRILSIYALDPLVLSGGKVHDKDKIEASVRKLLLELLDLSEKFPAPALPQPVVKIVNRKEQSEKVLGREPSQSIEMKRGDWLCPKCSFMNFSRNVRCLECKEEGPTKVSFEDVEMKKGDWNCPKCQFMNFARNTKCLRCQELRPKRILNPGEWECPSCDFLNYRRNMACLKCNCDRPKDEVAQYEEQIWRRP